MPKAQVKKFVSSLSREQLLELLLDAYSNNKDIKRYLDFMVSPDLDKLIKDTIIKLYACFFNPRNGCEVRSTKVSKANTIFKDFSQLAPDYVSQIEMSVFLLDLMLQRAEFYYGESFVKSIVAQFRRLSNLIVKAGMEEDYKDIMDTLISRSSPIGWSCTDRVYDILDAAFME